MAEDGGRRRHAWLALVVTGTLLAALAVSDGRPERWPFCHWTMYSTENWRPAQSVRSYQLRVKDTLGEHHRVWPKDLFTLDDDSSGQPAGKGLIGQVLKARGKRKKEVYEGRLLTRVEHVLRRPVAEVEVWRLAWNVNFGTYPPYDRDRPTDEKRVATVKRRHEARQ